MTIGDELAKTLTEKTRRDILSLLEQTAGRMAQTSVLQMQLRQVKYVTLSTAEIIGHLTYLRDLGLLHLLADGIAVKLTTDGSQCARGFGDYPGVGRAEV